MTIEEKRKIIGEFCDTQNCNTCPIYHECCKNGGWSFAYTISDKEDKSAGLVEAMYKAYTAYTDAFTDTAAEDTTKPEKPLYDPVNAPKHYASTSVECIDMMEETQGTEAVINFCICNAFKYLWRHNGKNGAEDIKKANWYLNKAVELMEKSDET